MVVVVVVLVLVVVVVELLTGTPHAAGHICCTITSEHKQVLIPCLTVTSVQILHTVFMNSRV